MAKYYCPYCKCKDISIKLYSNSIKTCPQCGDSLTKFSRFKPTQLTAIITAIAFMAPLFILIFSIFERERGKPWKAFPNPKTTYYPKAIFLKTNLIRFIK